MSCGWDGLGWDRVEKSKQLARFQRIPGTKAQLLGQGY